jgi:hypothetical protein
MDELESAGTVAVVDAKADDPVVAKAAGAEVWTQTVEEVLDRESDWSVVQTIEFYAMDRWHALTHLLRLALPKLQESAIVGELEASVHTGPMHVIVAPHVAPPVGEDGAVDPLPHRPVDFLVRPIDFVQV